VKAWVAIRYGGPEVLRLRDLPLPEAKEGEALVRVRAIGLNFADLFGRMGVYPGTPPPPFVPGLEFAGEVVGSVGDAANLPVGSAVMGYCRQGSHAEYVAVQHAFLIGLPQGMSFEEGAAFLAVGMTAYHGLIRLANLRAGEKLLVHAAAGGVGLAAVQLGRFLGAEIFATAGSNMKLERAHQFGAHHLLNYTTGEFAAEVRRLTRGYGVDVVMDSVGGKVFKKSWPLLAGMGRYILFGLGAVAGPGGLSRFRSARVVSSMLPIFPPALIGANKGIFGFNLGTLVGKEGYIRAAAGELLKLYDRGALRPVVGKVFPFSEMVEAHRFLQTRQSTGKVVIRVE
jgi:NADPH:quinone reductase-like Zn-dependent oxidoreductase